MILRGVTWWFRVCRIFPPSLLQPRAPPPVFSHGKKKLVGSDLLFSPTPPAPTTPLTLISDTSAPCALPVSPVARSRVYMTARATRWPSAHIHPQVIALFLSSLFCPHVLVFFHRGAVTHQRLLPSSGSSRHFPHFMLIFQTRQQSLQPIRVCEHITTRFTRTERGRRASFFNC